MTQFRDEVRECVELPTSLYQSLTEPPRKEKTLKKSVIRDIQSPSMSSSDRRSLADVGHYLDNPDTVIGIDRIAVTFPFKNFIIDNPKDWNTGPVDFNMNRTYAKWTIRYPIHPELVGDFTFSATVRRANGTGWLEIKPSTHLFGPKSLGLAELNDALKVLRLAYATAGLWLELIDPFEKLKLTRLDLTYDVDKVADVQRLLKKTIRFPHNKQVRIKPELKGQGRWESVIARSDTNGGFIVYDKTRQCKKGDSVVRFEANVYSKTLERYCPTVSYLTEELANRMFRHYFQNLIIGLSNTKETPLDGPLCDPKYRKRIVELAGKKLLERFDYHFEGGREMERAFRDLERLGIGGAIDAMLDMLEQ